MPLPIMHLELTRSKSPIRTILENVTYRLVTYSQSEPAETQQHLRRHDVIFTFFSADFLAFSFFNDKKTITGKSTFENFAAYHVLAYYRLAGILNIYFYLKLK